MRLNPSRAISSMFAFVLIVGVALAITIGFIGYAMSIWSQLGETRMIIVYPDTTINTEKNVLYLHLLNKGSVKAVIYKIEIEGKETINMKIDLVPGKELVLEIPLTQKYKKGQHYTLKIYTEEGNILKQPMYIPINVV